MLLSEEMHCNFDCNFCCELQKTVMILLPDTTLALFVRTHNTNMYVLQRALCCKPDLLTFKNIKKVPTFKE